MTASSRTFRIFVSSTFSDLKAERNALQERVFPRLRELCAAHGCRFQPVDLRWGVSEEAALDQQTMNICLGEIARCQRTSPRPNFILLLGDRYGWRPPPAEIPAEEFKRILPLVSAADRQLLKRWYWRDDNATPAVYCLQARRAEYESYEAWGTLEASLHAILETAARKLNLSPDEWLKYSASATEQEIMAGALRVVDAPGHVFCYFRQIEGMPQDGSAALSGFVDPDSEDEAGPKEDRPQAGLLRSLFRSHPAPAQARSKPAQLLADLKTGLRNYLPSNTHTYTARWTDAGPTLNHLEALCAEVYADLEKVILSEIALLEEVDPLEREIAFHDDFGRQRAAHFIGREDLLESIARYLDSGSRHPLAVWGESGCGKSALMARASGKRRESHPKAIRVQRFIGATPESGSGRTLLESLCRQVTRIYGGDESSIPLEYKELVQEFPRRLALATQAKPLVLFLDALDQLSDADNARSLGWLPAELPPHVKMVVSTLAGSHMRALEGRLLPAERLEVQAMSAVEGQAVLEAWLSEAKRTLQPAQKERILSRFRGCGLPLYLKLAFEEARRWKSYDPLPEMSPDIPGMIRQLFERLSGKENHGAVMVNRSLGYLAASRNGLSEDELLDLLSLDAEVIADFLRRSPKSPKVDRLPVVLWSRLYYDLEPYLTERAADGTSLLAFFHRQLAEISAADALKDNIKQERHHALADYFSAQPLYLESAGEKRPNLRKLSEQPSQQAWAGLNEGYFDTLTDYPFVEAKIETSGAQTLATDYDLARSLQQPLPPAERECLGLIQKSIRLSSRVIHQDKNQLAGQLFGRLVGKANPLVDQFLSKVREKHDGAWLCPLTPSLTLPEASLLFTIDQPITAFTVSQDGKRILTADPDRFTTWDAGTGAEIKTIPVGIHRTLVYDEKFKVFSPDGKRVASYFFGGAETDIKIWNFETGEVIQSPIHFSGTGRFSADGRLFAAVSVYSKQTPGPPGGPPTIFHDYYNLVVGNIETGETVFALKDIPAGLSFALTHDCRKILVSRSPDHLENQSNLPYVIEMYDMHNGKILSTWNVRPAFHGNISHGAFSPDDRMVLFVEGNTEICLRDAASGTLVKSFRGHQKEVHACNFSPDGKRISSSSDQELKIWDVEQGVEIRSVSGIPNLRGCLVSPDGKRLLTLGESLNVWDLESAAEEKPIAAHAGPVHACCFSADGRALASAGGDRLVRIWDPATRAEIRTLASSRQNPLFSCAMSPDGSRIAAVGDYAAGAVWETAGGKELGAFTGGGMSLHCVAFAPDGRRFATTGIDRQVDFRDAGSGERISSHPILGERPRTWIGPPRTYCAFSPDGRWVVSPGKDDSWISVWDAESGEEIMALIHQPEWTVRDCSFSPDGKRLVSAGEDKTLKTWDLERRIELNRLVGHTGGVNACRFSADGRLIASASDDRTLRVWEAASGEELAAFTGMGAMNCCAFSPDRNLVCCGDTEGILYFLELAGV